MDENQNIDGITFLNEEFIESEPFGIARTIDPDEMNLIAFKEKEKRRKEWEELKRKKSEIKEVPALIWLAKEIKLTRKEEMLIEALKIARSNGYEVIEISKRDGGKRKINIPTKTLKKVQRRINKHILNTFLPPKNVSGFSGGSIQEAITPHLKAQSILMVDFKNAFPSVSSVDVFNYLTEGMVVNITHYGKKIYTKKVEHFGYFSWHAAKIITDLVTSDGKLPQGAPTSPRLFDLVCRKIDERLSKLATNVGGAYTRYADNIFFSFNDSFFPGPIRQAILKIIEGEGHSRWNHSKQKHWRPTPHFGWHKLKIKTITHNTAIRLLGLNMLNQEIHNTRNFKRNLRLSIHHINWLLSHNMRNSDELETAWKKLQGQMNFARTDTLPLKLTEAYLELQKQLT